LHQKAKTAEFYSVNETREKVEKIARQRRALSSCSSSSKIHRGRIYPQYHISLPDSAVPSTQFLIGVAHVSAYYPRQPSKTNRKLQEQKTELVSLPTTGVRRRRKIRDLLSTKEILPPQSFERVTFVPRLVHTEKVIDELAARARLKRNGKCDPKSIRDGWIVIEAKREPFP
jgi:hypothetical protein